MMLLTALANGTPITEFQPQNNKQAYLAYLCGADVPLNEPDTMEEAMLYALCMKGVGVGGIKINNASYLFYKGARLDQKEELLKAASGANNMSYMFSGCTELKAVDMSEFDTSNTTSMSYIFQNCENLAEIVGFSAAGGVGLSIGFPTGGSLKRLTFRTDIDNPIRSAINISNCKFERNRMVEMFHSLPNITGKGVSTKNSTITITGNPCAGGGTVQIEAAMYEFTSYEELESKIIGDGLEDVICSVEFEGSNMNVPGAELLGMFAEGMPEMLVVGIPSYEKTYEALTSADKAIATAKGWTVVGV